MREAGGGSERECVCVRARGGDLKEAGREANQTAQQTHKVRQAQHSGGSHLCIRHQRPSTHSPAHRSQSRVSLLSMPDSDLSPALPAPAAPSHPQPTYPSHRTCRLQAVRAWQRVEGGTVSTYREWAYLIPCEDAEHGDHLWADW